MINRLPHTILTFALILWIWRTFVLITVAGSDIVTNYPWMWPDSFDWIGNALYYLQTFGEGTSKISPTIRQPLFPLLLILGLKLFSLNFGILCIQAAGFLTIVAFYKLATSLKVHPGLATVGICVLVFHNFQNQFGLYFMADPICICLQTFAAYYFVKSINDGFQKKSFMLTGALLSSFASITQFYGLFPSISFIALLGLSALIKRKWSLMLRALEVFFTAASLHIVWMIFKKLHFGSFFASKVSQFSLLEFSLKNTEFYINVWGVFYFSLFVLFLLLLPFISLKKTSDILSKFSHLSFLAITSVMYLCAIYFYQWQESRFSTYGFIFVLLSGIYLLDLSTRKSQHLSYWIIVCVVCSYVSCVSTKNLMNPKFENYWDKLTNPYEALQSTYFSKISTDKVGNRYVKDKRCLTKNKENKIRPGCDKYVYRNIIHYTSYK